MDDSTSPNADDRSYLGRVFDSYQKDKLACVSRDLDLSRRQNDSAAEEIARLNSRVRQLQEANEWANAEIEHLSSMISRLENDNRRAEEEIQRFNSLLELLI